MRTYSWAPNPSLSSHSIVILRYRPNKMDRSGSLWERSMFNRGRPATKIMMMNNWNPRAIDKRVL